MIGWWAGIGSQMIIYIAGLKGIPSVLYESAEIDGAGPWAKFWNITVPMLSPTILFNVVTQLIGAFQSFDHAWALTEGGPNNATRVYIVGYTKCLYLYEDGLCVIDGVDTLYHHPDPHIVHAQNFR